MGGDNRYRPDIDGLRAVAVALVILYHLRPAALPSGYLGVDIFFVISGYVVARSALSKVTGAPLRDIWAFWMRRIRRIVPPLALVVSVGALAAAAVFPPFPTINYETIFRTGGTALFGLSNLYLTRTATDYFLLDTAQLNPFLHTWSLGVEEQYYVLFAILALGLPAVLQLKAARRWFLIGLFGAVTLGSLGWAITSQGPDLSKFYLPQTRIWEIALGSLAAVVGLGGKQAGAWQKARTPLRLGLLIAVIGLAFAPHSEGHYPAVSVFLGCLAALGLVAVAPASGGRASGWLEPLQWRPVVYVGLISYGLYLWHWVVLFVLQATIGTASALTVILAVGAPFALSAVSYRFVERPFRDHRRMSDRRVLAILIPALAATLALLAVVHQSPGKFYGGRAQDWSGEWMPVPEHAYASGKITKLDCHLSGSTPKEIPAPCIARHDGAQAGRTILSLGDSHSFSDWGMLRATHEKGWDWAALSKDGCPLSQGNPDCVAYWQQASGYVTATVAPGDVVYVSVHWADRQFSEDYETLDRLAAAAAAKGATLVIKGPLPVLPRASFLCTAERFRTYYDGCTVPRTEEQARIAPRAARLAVFAADHPNVRIFSPFEQLCPGKECSAFRNGKPLFRDANHLAVWGSTSLAVDFVPFLDAAPRP